MCTGGTLAQLPILMTPFWLDLLVEQQRVSSVGASWIIGWEFLCAAVSNLYMVRLIFRYSARALGVFGVLCLLLASTLCAISQELPVLWIGRGAAGVGEGMLAGIAQVMAAKTAHPDRAYAVMNMSVGLSSLALLQVIPGVAGHWGAAGIFNLTALCALVCLPPLVKLGRGSSAGTDRNASPRAKAVLSRSVAVFLAIMIASIAVQGLWTFAVSQAHRLDISRATMSHVMTVSLLCGLLGSAASGFLSGRLPRLALIGMGIALLAVAAFWFGYARSQLLYFTAICLLPLAYGICFPLLFGLLAKLDPHRATAAGSVASLIGTAIGSPAVGIALARGAYAAFFWGNCATLLLAWGLAAYAAGRRESQADGSASRILA